MYRQLVKIIQSRYIIISFVGSWVVISLIYCNTFNLIKTNGFDVHALANLTGGDDYLINTPGCIIPNYAKTLRFIEAKESKQTCGERAVFIEKVNEESIKFRIDEILMRRHYSGVHNIKCCYRFVSRSTKQGKEDTHITSSSCEKFDDGSVIKLLHEILTVTCSTNPEGSKSKITYEDSYIFIKKKRNKIAKRERSNYNVLILGMDTMSRGRLLSTMPKTVEYFKQHRWLDYRGYQKIGFNTFPNLIAFLTGMKLSSIYENCMKDMYMCNDFMIWSKFQNQGYATAYGEDYLSLPDTFGRYNGFSTPPTDHYMRTFFLTGESIKGNLICAKHLPSAIHTLNYAVDFVNSYKKEQFFGMFWLNSYSHNLNNLPTLIDKDMTMFFDKLNSTGALRNTFVFFLSDHGIRFGKMRLPVESYFEERLPMLYTWVPLDFREDHAMEYYNLQINQNRLTTPYDLHQTFQNIAEWANRTMINAKCEACPNCSTLFEEKSQFRTCNDVSVPEKWCSCHDLNSMDDKEYGAKRSTQLAVTEIQNITKPIKTIPCMTCHTLQLKKVLRIHSHVDYLTNTTYYVIAILMTPGDVAYETTVKEEGGNFEIVAPTETISEYNTRGSCVINQNDRAFCVCKEQKNVIKNIQNDKCKVLLFHTFQLIPVSYLFKLILR